MGTFRKRMAGWAFFVAALAILASAYLLNDSSPDALIGRWEFENGSETIEFFEDGTFSVTHRSFGRMKHAERTYEIIGRHRLRVVVDEPEIVREAKFHVDGARLTLIDPDGEVNRFRRVRRPPGTDPDDGAGD